MNAGGLNNTRFVSDVTMTNPGTAAVQATITFLPSATPNPKSVTLNAGATLVYRNVVDSLFGTSGAGALSISLVAHFTLQEDAASRSPPAP